RDSRLYPEGIHDAGLDLAARDGNIHVGRAFALHGHTHLRAAGTAQHVGNLGRIEADGVLAVHRYDVVAAAEVRFISGRADKRPHGSHFVAVRVNLHADAAIRRALLALHLAILCRVHEVGVRIERAQHARNCALVERLFRVHRIGEILLHDGKRGSDTLHIGFQIVRRGCGCAGGAGTPASTPDDLETDMKSVASAFAVVEQNFADPVDSEKAFYQGAIPGMLRTLDPHSNFVDPAEYREMQRKQRAAYCGFGMEIYPDGNKVAAMRPFVGAPAYKADLRRGDHIIAVDGKNAVGLDSAKVADMLRGPCGTQVRVTMEREGSPNVNVSVTRGQIETSIVDAFWVKPGIAFLRVDSFEAQNIAHDVEADMKKLGEENVQGMVLDLRNNPGGLVTEAVRLAGRFLRDGQIVVSHRGRAEQEQVFRAQAVPAAQKYPIVVLVNGSSA